MAFEKKWAVVPVQLLLSDGTSDGQLQIADAFSLKVKQIILLKSNTQPTLQLQVKRVTDPTTLSVGTPGTNIDQRVDVSAYLVSDGASISNFDPHQVRSRIGPEEFNRAVYDEEPTVAVRSILVDRGGRYIGSDADSPFYVRLTDGSINIGTVNAELEVQLSHKDNYPHPGDVNDSVRIGDGVDEMAVNPDGSINVNLVPSNTAVDVHETYNEISAVPTSTPTLLVNYTAPSGKLCFLSKIYFSGDNIAKYVVKLNGSNIDTVRTYFGGDLNGISDFSDASRGKLLSVGDLVEVYVEHQRPDVGDFNGRIQTIEV